MEEINKESLFFTFKKVFKLIDTLSSLLKEQSRRILEQQDINMFLVKRIERLEKMEKQIVN